MADRPALVGRLVAAQRAAAAWGRGNDDAQFVGEVLAEVLDALAAGAQPASVDAETLRQVADELADWTFPDPDETQPHSAYRVALLERLYRYVGLLRSRADLADREPDGSWVCGRCGGSPESHAASECVYDPTFRREPDGLRAKVEALAERWSSEGITCECGHYVGHDHNSRGCYAVVTYSPLVRCSCVLTDDRGDDDLAAAQLRALLAHPATDQEVDQ